MSTKNTSRARKGRGGERRARNTDVDVPRAIASTTRINRTFRKKLCVSGVLQTTAGGYLGLQQIINTTQVTSVATWSYYAGVALEYRVLMLEVEGFPIVNCQTNFTTPVPCMAALSIFSSGAIGSNFPEVAEGPNSTLVDPRHKWKKCADMRNYPNALTWTSIASTIAGANEVGIAICDTGTAPAGPASTTVFRFVATYLVEFRSLM